MKKAKDYDAIIGAVIQSVHQSINLQEVLENAAQVIIKNIPKVKHIAIYMVEGKEAVLKAYRGYPDWFIERAGRIPHPKGLTWKTIIEGKPRYCADVDKDEFIGLAGRELGIKSYLSMPIHSEGKTIGCININSFSKNAFNKEEINLLGTLVQQIEIAINNTHHIEALRKAHDELEALVQERTVKLEKINEELKAEIEKRKQTEKELSVVQRYLAFLAEASVRLSVSLDYETTLKNVVSLVVPEMADWCAVDIIDEKGALKRLAVAHGDLAKVDLAYEIERRYPTSMNAIYGMPNVLRTSKPELYTEIPDALLVEVARDSEHLQILRDIGLKSAMCVPLISRGQTLGVLTFAMAESGRRYNSDDLTFAEDLARRAATAIDNARLYRSAQRAEELFSSFMQNLPAAAWIKDAQGRYVYVNRFGEEIFHRKLSDLIGKMDEEIFPTDTAKQSKENDRIVIMKGESIQTVETLIHDDEIRHSIVSKFPIFDHNRDISMVGGVAIDITEHIKTQEALQRAKDDLETRVRERYAELIKANEALQSEITERKRAEERLERISHQMELILNSAGEGICGLDIEGNITFINPYGAKVIGWEAREIIGKSMHDIFHHSKPDGTHYQPEECPIYKSLRNGSTYHIDNEVFWRKDGEGFPVEYISTPIREGGKVVGAVVTFSDITERKRIEEDRLKFSKLESLGILAGGIAHDFNNLLTGIMTAISSVKADSHISADVHENLTEAEKACIQAKRLTQQLLTFSRGGAPVKKLTSIEQIIRESVSFALSGSNVKCNVSIEEGLWDAEVDQGQISQAITNLLINADQAMPQGGIINVMARNIDYRGEDPILKEGRYVRITVEDEGIGIPQEYIARIFDPYFTTKQKGSGLGLAVAYSIIKNHDGFIDVESELGKGTKFYIYIPASQKRIEERGIEQKKTPDGKGRVLIMDDEAIIRRSAGRALERIGYDVEYASDGAEAIKLYIRAKEANKRFDAVIMDLTVPGGMGGKEAIEKLISIDPEVKAIVSSGYSNDSVMSEFMGYGFRGVLSKPYTIEELSDILRKVIEEK